MTDPHDENTIEQTLSLAGSLKERLVTYAGSARLRTAWRRYLAQDDRGDQQTTEQQVAVLDDFIMAHRPSDGRSVLERFLNDQKLTRQERQIVEAWQTRVEGVFLVESIEDDHWVLLNLVDELPYITRTTMGAQALQDIQVGMCVAARIVPLLGDWMVSGAAQVFMPRHPDEPWALAVERAQRDPAALFRNPEKLTEGWRMQAERRQTFIEHFGDDETIVPGIQMRAAMEGYFRALVERSRGQAGDANPSLLPDTDAADVPQALRQVETVGIVFDEVMGLQFFPDYGALVALFQHPSETGAGPWRDVALRYLQSPTIDPALFRRLARRYPDTISQVMGDLLEWPGFRWGEHGDAFLAELRPDWPEQRLPEILPFSDDQIRGWRYLKQQEQTIGSGGGVVG